MDSNGVIHIAVNMYGAMAVTLLLLFLFGLKWLAESMEKKHKRERLESQKFITYAFRSDGKEWYRVGHGGHPRDGVVGKMKEEAKMSKVKITYKPIDKDRQVSEYLNDCIASAKMGVYYSAKVMADKIVSIYNAKQEDGEIKQAEVTKEDITLSFVCGLEKTIHAENIYLQMRNTEYVLQQILNKQEVFELGQALIKMSGHETNNVLDAAKKSCKNCTDGPPSICSTCRSYDKWRPMDGGK